MGPPDALLDAIVTKMVRTVVKGSSKCNNLSPGANEFECFPNIAGKLENLENKEDKMGNEGARLNLPGFVAEASQYTKRTNYLGSSAGSFAQNLSRIQPQLPVGGGASGTSCEDRYQSCYIGCSVDYPESNDSANNLNAMMRQGCEDSCDASYNLCKTTVARAPIIVRGPGGITSPISAW